MSLGQLLKVYWSCKQERGIYCIVSTNYIINESSEEIELLTKILQKLQIFGLPQLRLAMLKQVNEGWRIEPKILHLKILNTLWIFKVIVKICKQFLLIFICKLLQLYYNTYVGGWKCLR